MWTYGAIIKRVVDADTIDVVIDLGFRLTTTQRVRVARIDAWEVRGSERERGLAAKARVEALLPVGSWCRVQTSKTGKFGRWIAEVTFHNSEDQSHAYNLSDLLVAEGHAEFVEY